jgi:hypothetical protein
VSIVHRKIACALALLWSSVAAAQNQPANVQQAVDTMVRLCIIGGHTEANTVSGTGGADVSLRTLDVKGNLTGQITINKSNAEGLVNGINNAMSQVAADQADKMRDCLKPVRDRILDLLLPITPTRGGGVQQPGSAGETGIATINAVLTRKVGVTLGTRLADATPAIYAHVSNSEQT